MKRLPSPWRELLGGLLLLLATLAVSKWFPAGFAPIYAQPAQQQPAAGVTATKASSSPRAKGARAGEQPFDTSRRADRAGYI